MNTAGQVDTLIKLDEDVFVKPEGIAFSPTEIYTSATRVI